MESFDYSKFSHLIGESEVNRKCIRWNFYRLFMKLLSPFNDVNFSFQRRLIITSLSFLFILWAGRSVGKRKKKILAQCFKKGTNFIWFFIKKLFVILARLEWWIFLVNHKRCLANCLLDLKKFLNSKSPLESTWWILSTSKIFQSLKTDSSCLFLLSGCAYLLKKNKFSYFTKSWRYKNIVILKITFYFLFLFLSSCC